MKVNKGLNRDFNPTNQPANTYRDANNLVMSKDGDRLESELSSKKIENNTNGIVGLLDNALIIGEIETPNELIIFQTYAESGYVYIFRYKDNVTELILGTQYFNSSEECPIQGEYKYNYKKELIILFYSDCDIPRILNLDDLGFELTVNKEFIISTDEFKTRQYNRFKTTNISLNSTKISGNLYSGIYQFAIQYKLNDDSYTNFSQLSNPIPLYKFNSNNDWYNIYANETTEATSKGIQLAIDSIDTTFTKFRLGIVYKSADATTCYTTTNFYTNNNIVQVSDVGTLTETTLSEILINSLYIDTIKASTVVNNVLYVGNFNTTEDLKYQKYACNINSEFVFEDDVALDTYTNSYKDELVLFLDKSFMPFEIYDFYIDFIKIIDGQPTNAFHIPGRALTNVEKSDSVETEELLIYDNAKNFHFNDYSGAEDGDSKMGCWENESTQYPDDDEYDGSIDYDGVTIVGGKNLKNSNNRFHRFPSLRGLVKGGFDIIKSSSTTNYNASATFNDSNYNPVVFLNTNVVPSTGIISDNRFKNNTGYNTSGVVSFSFNMTCYTSVINASIQILNSDGTVDSEIGTTPTPDNILNWSEAVDDVVLEDGQSLYINIYAGDSDYDGIYHTSTNFLTYDFVGQFEVTSLNGKKLGIKFSNIQIPDYIKEQCSHYRILYKERTNGELSVVSQSFIDIDNNFSPSGVKSYPFDMLYNKPDREIIALRPEIELNTNILTEDTIVTESSNSTVYSIIKSKYVYRDIGYSSPINNYQEPYVYLDSDNTILENKNNTIATLLNFKPNLYIPDSNSTLVNTGKVYEILDVDTINTTTIYGGDVVNNLHGITTYTTGNIDIGEIIDYYLLPVFSISNIGYRYTDEDPINLFYPKYNVLDGTEGIGTTFSGQIDYENNDIINKIYSLHADQFDSEESVQLYKIDEYYGYENIINSINNVDAHIIFNITNDFTYKFPYRIQRGVTQGTESLANSWRRFYATDYYDSAYNKGDIIQLDHDENDLLIEHKNALFVVKSLDELQISNGVVAALGSSDIFDNKPKEIVADDSGYVGCQSKFASFRCPFGNIIVDREQGKIFLYDNYQVDEISKYGLFKWFEHNLDYILLDSVEEGIYLFDDESEVVFDDDSDIIYVTQEELESSYNEIDNPYNGLGVMAAYDKDNERIIFAKNQSQLNDDYSWTLSYYPKHKCWVSFHTYIPNTLVNNRNGIFMGVNETSTSNTSLYQIVGDENTHGDSYDDGNYSPTFIDVCFSLPYNIDKNFMSFNWNTQIKTIVDKQLNTSSFEEAIVYNYHRHSGAIALTVQSFESGNIRNTDGTWKFNDFRDLLSSKSTKILDCQDIRELQLDTIPTIDQYTNWYEKGKFIDTYIIIRLKFNNSNGDGIIINDIGSVAIKSGRI